MANNTSRLNRLVELLKELFQLDQPDLDFGLYIIMHAKAGEITQFLEKDLLPQVREAFEQYQPADKAVIQHELDELIDGIEKAGMNPDDSPTVMEKRNQLAEGVDLTALEDETYDHLYSFFRRYYSEGDILAKRVYKQDVYAVPYEGEEVVLHWANKDQYYIKTSEYLRDYAFRLKPENENNPMRVHFHLVDVAEAEHGNIKATEGKDRVFILASGGDSGHDFITIEKVDDHEELRLGFEYRPATVDDWTDEAKASTTAAAKQKPPKQKDLTAIAVKAVLGAKGDAPAPWVVELAKPHIKVNGESADYCRLEGHLNRYGGRNTFDYFIHKDVGRFLRRELDFYIKNEVMHLDDIENEDAPKVEQYISKIKVIRRIAGKLIDFLAQLEDFQKKLWLKKKFVVETSWCIRVGCISETFFPEIAANDAQREEWVRLFAINEVKADLTTPGYSEQLTPEFLKAHPTLVLDTSHFDGNFTARLLDTFEDLDEQTDGMLVHSENFQALHLLRRQLRSRVECVYIDPPYNTGDSEIPYKNAYLRSSWLSLMESRLDLVIPLLTDDPVLFIAIDDFEMVNLSMLVDSQYSALHREMIIVNHHPQGGKATILAHTHEYMLTCVSRTSNRALAGRARDDGIDVERRPFKRSGTAESNFRYGRPNSFYAILVDPFTKRVVGLEPPPTGSDYPTEKSEDGFARVYPIGENGQERVWRRSFESCQALVENGKLDSSESMTIYQLLSANERTRALFSNWVDPQYNAGTFGANLLRDIIGAPNLFAYPKSVHTIADAIFSACLDEGAIVLDYFAGSGTTGHAVINLNREDGNRRRFILVETAGYFDTVLLPRIKKVTFSPEWKDGKPQRLATDKEADRAPRIVKVIRLESYEDALNNLVAIRTQKQQLLLDDRQSQSEGIREQFLLRYMLDVETRGSPSLLNVTAFTDPAGYKLKVKRPGSDESRELAVDLLETFNYLIGLHVNHISVRHPFSAEFERDPEHRLQLKGRRGSRLRPKENGKWWFRTVTGTTPDGKRTLIIWRKRPGGDKPDGVEQDNLVLDEWFRKQGYSTGNSEFDLVYVNGDNNLANLRQEEAGDTGIADVGWKVRVIEEDFHRLMFDMEGA